MKRTLLITLSVGLLLLVYGVVRTAGWIDAAWGEEPARQPAAATDPKSLQQQQAELDQLMQQMAGPQGDLARTKEELRRSLLEADKELRHVLGGNAKRLIEQANRRPASPVIGGRPRPVVRQTPPELLIGPDAPPDETANLVPPSLQDPDEPQTPLVRALWGALDSLDAQQLAPPGQAAPQTAPAPPEKP